MAYKRRSPILIVEGGTGVQSNTAYAVLCGGTTSTGAIQSIAGVGSSGQVLTSNGAGTLPTFQTISPSGAITSITGNTGGSQTGPGITLTGGTTGLSFGGSSNTITTTFAGITANGGTVSLATDATASSINIGTGAGVKTVIVGSTNTTSTSTLRSGTGGTNITSSNGNVTINAGSGTIGIGTDFSTSTLNIGTQGSKAITIGSSGNTPSLDLKTGGFGNITISAALGGNVVISTNTGDFSANTNGGTVNISTDSANNTINIGTGSGNKTVRIGSITGSSSLTLNSGTAGIFALGVNGVTTPNAAVPVLVDTVNGRLGTISSSRLVKHNIEDMKDESSSIFNLRPVTFVYNNDVSEKKQYGLIAEEVDEILPDIVIRNKDGQIETVQYHVLPILLLNEIKKLNERIKILEKRS